MEITIKRLITLIISLKMHSGPTYEHVYRFLPPFNCLINGKLIKIMRPVRRVKRYQLNS